MLESPTWNLAQLLTAILRFIPLLPLSTVHVIGGVLGRWVYRLSPTYRQRVRANLAQAGLPESMRSAAAAEAGKQALESAWIWMRPAEDLRRVFEVADVQLASAVLADSRPLIYLTPHLGSFEMIGIYCGLTHGSTRPMTALFREPRQQFLLPMMMRGRCRFGTQVAPANVAGVRILLRALKRKQSIVILPDQVPSEGDGVWAPFFGKPAYTMTLPGRLASATDANVVVIGAERLPRGRGYRIHLAPLADVLSGEAAHDAELINRALEQIILRFPQQYLWGYNRYKTPAGARPGPDAANQRNIE